MTKSELIKAMEDFPDDIPIRTADNETPTVEEVCPTGTGTSENYLLIS